MTLALLCSGQGNQHAGMFALTADAREAAPVFAAAAEALGGRDARALVRAGCDLHDNRTGQILCCTQALAAHAALRGRLPERLILAGYSVGELASWGLTGLIDPAGLIALAVERAEAMDAAGGEGEGLAFVRGLRRDAVDALCATHGCAVAIVNPGEMFVIGGRCDDLAAACRAAERQGATRAGALAVAVASHTPRLAAAAQSFAETLHRSLAGLAGVRVDPRLRLIAGIDAGTVRRLDGGVDKLAAQVARTIAWQGCLEAAAEAGMTAALELGPGHALAAMVAGAYPAVNSRSLDDFRSLDGVGDWLAALG